MSNYVNTEEMRRAASQMDSAAETMRRASGQFDDAVFRLEKLLGQGYGGNIERLVEALEKLGIRIWRGSARESGSRITFA